MTFLEWQTQVRDYITVLHASVFRLLYMATNVAVSPATEGTAP